MTGRVYAYSLYFSLPVLVCFLERVFGRDRVDWEGIFDWLGVVHFSQANCNLTRKQTVTHSICTFMYLVTLFFIMFFFAYCFSCFHWFTRTLFGDLILYKTVCSRNELNLLFNRLSYSLYHLFTLSSFIMSQSRIIAIAVHIACFCFSHIMFCFVL